MRRLALDQAELVVVRVLELRPDTPRPLVGFLAELDLAAAQLLVGSLDIIALEDYVREGADTIFLFERRT
jgi:hypothetical protein